MDGGIIRVGKGLRAYPEDAAARYSEMGFPDDYKVVLKYSYSSPGQGWFLFLYKLEPTFSRWLGKYKGDQWTLKKTSRVSIIHQIDDEEVDVIARAWLFEIQRFQRIAKRSADLERIDRLEGN